MDKKKQIHINLSQLIILISVIIIIIGISEKNKQTPKNIQSQNSTIKNSSSEYQNIQPQNPTIKNSSSEYQNIQSQSSNQQSKYKYRFDAYDEQDIRKSAEDHSGKPIIYFYPTEPTEISVKLGNENNITCIYPEYNRNWTVTAYPDGTLIDTKNNKKYYSLYYECINTKLYNSNFEEGFIVEKNNITKFLEEKLSILGLNYKEAEEFIIYWLPRLQEHDYLYIRFQTMDEIEKNMPLIFSKTPDTLIRIQMEWKGLENPISVKEQVLSPVSRNGFTIVEWGASEINNNIIN